MNWQTVRGWEKEHNKEYPYWAAVWVYDGYGECWESALWKENKEYFQKERKSLPGNAMWDFQYEPMVCLPTDTKPKWGDGVLLKRETSHD